MNHQRVCWRVSRATGFTLIEILITLALVAILATSALSSYRHHIHRTQRLDATTALLAAAAAQERHLLQYYRYAVSLSAPPPEGLGRNTVSERGFYALELSSAADGLGWQLSAAALPGRAQWQDLDCRLFLLDHRGQRGAAAAASVPDTAARDRCWR